MHQAMAKQCIFVEFEVLKVHKVGREGVLEEWSDGVMEVKKT